MRRSLAVTRMAACDPYNDFTRSGLVAGESVRVILSLVLVLGLISRGATVA